uniref:PPPDE domain-containing protein n=1 Tax=Chromera velia CCMP2878 TaxID=1169474 RepID=A0A0G4HER5_9ALVE|eukprot:Cvel_26674.t1-p1 / transcript=Cvel_26674.t1 / gene=Cvel_26674 / organism=Chromera_velia_CCMP2878 / gene_product=Sporulation protein RMD1, putative / transcript_product=Sporulation protein RMD1, putative / location=Cvel_scaffold3211:1743-16457(-) / protein_length=1468 / sequence_SO=supercontig / SO=protein_coding / is_pseudo=false
MFFLEEAEALEGFERPQLGKHVSRSIATNGSGGVYHVSLVVGGLEWAFEEDEEKVPNGTDIGGIIGMVAGTFPSWGKEPAWEVSLGETGLSHDQIFHIVDELHWNGWLGRAYDLFRHNCVHFSEALLEAMREKTIGVDPQNEVEKWKKRACEVRVDLETKLYRCAGMKGKEDLERRTVEKLSLSRPSVIGREQLALLPPPHAVSDASPKSPPPSESQPPTDSESITPPKAVNQPRGQSFEDSSHWSPHVSPEGDRGGNLDTGSECSGSSEPQVVEPVASLPASDRDFARLLCEKDRRLTASLTHSDTTMCASLGWLSCCSDVASPPPSPPPSIDVPQKKKGATVCASLSENSSVNLSDSSPLPSQADSPQSVPLRHSSPPSPPLTVTRSESNAPSRTFIDLSESPTGAEQEGRRRSLWEAEAQRRQEYTEGEVDGIKEPFRSRSHSLTAGEYADDSLSSDSGERDGGRMNRADTETPTEGMSFGEGYLIDAHTLPSGTDSTRPPVPISVVALPSSAGIEEHHPSGSSTAGERQGRGRGSLREGRRSDAASPSRVLSLSRGSRAGSPSARAPGNGRKTDELLGGPGKEQRRRSPQDHQQHLLRSLLLETERERERGSLPGGRRNRSRSRHIREREGQGRERDGGGVSGSSRRPSVPRRVRQRGGGGPVQIFLGPSSDGPRGSVSGGKEGGAEGEEESAWQESRHFRRVVGLARVAYAYDLESMAVDYFSGRAPAWLRLAEFPEDEEGDWAQRVQQPGDRERELSVLALEFDTVLLSAEYGGETGGSVEVEARGRQNEEGRNEGVEIDGEGDGGRDADDPQLEAYEVERRKGACFVFRRGTVVLWGVDDPSSERRVREFIDRFLVLSPGQSSYSTSFAGAAGREERRGDGESVTRRAALFGTQHVNVHAAGAEERPLLAAPPPPLSLGSRAPPPFSGSSRRSSKVTPKNGGMTGRGGREGEHPMLSGSVSDLRQPFLAPVETSAAAGGVSGHSPSLSHSRVSVTDRERGGQKALEVPSPQLQQGLAVSKSSDGGASASSRTVFVHPPVGVDRDRDREREASPLPGSASVASGVYEGVGVGFTRGVVVGGRGRGRSSTQRRAGRRREGMGEEDSGWFGSLVRMFLPSSWFPSHRMETRRRVEGRGVRFSSQGGAVGGRIYHHDHHGLHSVRAEGRGLDFLGLPSSLSSSTGFKVAPLYEEGGGGMNEGSAGVSAREELLFASVPFLPEALRDMVPRSRVKNDRIFLKGVSLAEKLAVSFAVAQSVELTVFENSFEATLTEVQKVPTFMAEGRGPAIGDHHIMAAIGDTVLKMMDINAVSDLLDIPDFFWASDSWQWLYHRVHKYLEIEDRLALLNNRYETTRDFFGVVQTERRHATNFRLYWIIILLLAMQMVAQIIHSFTSHPESKVTQALFPLLPRPERTDTEGADAGKIITPVLAQVPPIEEITPAKDLRGVLRSLRGGSEEVEQRGR